MDITKYIGETTEYDKKQEVERHKVKSWLKSVSAFANGNGGTLLFGIANNDTQGDTQSDTQDCTKDCTKQITDRQGVIVRLVELSATITIPEIARKTSISERTIKSEMKALQELGLLRRVGGRKTGHWEVVEKEKTK